MKINLFFYILVKGVKKGLLLADQYKFVSMDDGIRLCTHIHKAGKEKNWIIVSHGVGEHLERHSYLIDDLGDRFNIFRYDLRGHGRSEGRPCYISEFNLFSRDLGVLILYLKKSFGVHRPILFGHSMGALIVSGWLRFERGETDLMGVFLSAPPVGFPGLLGKGIELLSDSALNKLTTFPLSVELGGMVNLDYLSHDPQIKEKYMADPYNRSKLHSKLLLEMVKYSREVFSRPMYPSFPAFVAIGSGDQVVNVESLKEYFSKVEKNFDLEVFTGGRHELHNEVDRYREPYLNFLKNSMDKISAA